MIWLYKVESLIIEFEGIREMSNKEVRGELTLKSTCKISEAILKVQKSIFIQLDKVQMINYYNGHH